MQQTPTWPPQSPIPAGGLHPACPSDCPRRHAGGCPSPVSSSSLAALQQASQASGGLLRAVDLCRRYGASTAQVDACLNRWLGDRQALCVVWHGRAWLPAFQFEAQALAVKPAVALVLAELAEVLDRRRLCQWFLQPQPGLGCRSPAQAVDETAALAAVARLDRFVLRG